jgi:hypothetical protein
MWQIHSGKLGFIYEILKHINSRNLFAQQSRVQIATDWYDNIKLKKATAKTEWIFHEEDEYSFLFKLAHCWVTNKLFASPLITENKKP